MTFEIKNGRLAGARFVSANSFGGALKPTLIILHDTAGRLDKGNSVSWFASKSCTTSAHVVVERDGTITQMVPFNRRAWHAGQSQWQGKKLCNSFAIGIEIVNPGKCGADGRAWFHKKAEPGYEVSDLKHAKTKEHGDGYWMPYTPEQVKAVKDLCRALVAEYPDVNDIATHWQVSPGRKVDTCPLFPLKEVEDYAFGHAEPETIDEPVEVVKPAPVTAKELSKVSRKVSWARRMKQTWQGITVSSILAALGLSKNIADQVGQIIAEHWLALIITAAILGVLAWKYIETLSVEDVNEGRSIPSGEVDPEMEAA